MQNTNFSIIFQHLSVADPQIAADLSPTSEYNEYAEIAELSRFAEALKEPEPLSFTIG
jgi:hypothetical protein